MKTNTKLKLGETAFWPVWLSKLLFTLISVKFWGLITGTLVSTSLLMVHLYHEPVIVGDKLIEYGINGAQWVTFNTTIWALIFGMKEIFRISEQRDLTELENLKERLESKLKIAGMISCDMPEYENNPDKNIEKVGSDPDEI